MLLPAVAWGWGGRTHIDISYRAGRIVPAEMREWRDYAYQLAIHSINPDLWKGFDSDEGPRHYIEPEHLGGVALADVPRDRQELLERIGRRGASQTGLAPWVILELYERLVAGMAGGNWKDAANVAAALGHYVADTHMPLHCTAFYDGATQDDRGLHGRWELELQHRFWSKQLLQTDSPRYLTNVWAASLAWMQKAHDRAPAIMEADQEAADAAGGKREGDVYYAALWEISQDIFIEQVSEAATDLASVWYSAWVDAGRPEIPPAPDELSRGTVFAKTASVAEGRMPPWIFGAGLGAVGIAILLLSLLRNRGAKPV